MISAEFRFAIIVAIMAIVFIGYTFYDASQKTDGNMKIENNSTYEEL
jgi:cbb3-type cytochrome oxidase subunit 3